MPVKYYVRANKLNNSRGKYMANVIAGHSIDQKAIIKYMKTQGSTVTTSDILSVMEDYHSAIEHFLQDGYNVRTPMANFSSSIQGTFDNIQDRFHRSRHRIRPRLNPGIRLQELYRTQIKARYTHPEPNIPNLTTLTDAVSGEENRIISPGSMATLSGQRMKIDDGDERCGVFLIDENRNESRVQIYGLNKPKRLIFSIPENLTPGNYRLEVRTLIKGNLRSGQLGHRLQLNTS